MVSLSIRSHFLFFSAHTTLTSSSSSSSYSSFSNSYSFFFPYEYGREFESQSLSYLCKQTHPNKNFNNKRKMKKNSLLRVNCIGTEREGAKASPYEILQVDPSSSLADIKSAFRAREFHPDVCKDAAYSDVMIRQVIQAYKRLLKEHSAETYERECLDPFEEPECEAFDLFVNEAVCIGQGCPYSCVARAPYAFSFDSIYGTARATSQGHGEDNQVQLAVSQCPRSCIHYVTPSQRIILEELLESVLNTPFNSAEAATLESLIVKAKFENNRYQEPKKTIQASDKYVDWY